MEVMKRVCASAVWVDAGITTQEYAPVLPQSTNGMGSNQLESNGYANTHEPRGRYMDGPDSYDQEEQGGVNGFNPQGGTGRHGYFNGGNSYNSGQGGINKYQQQAGRLSLLQLAAQFRSSALHIGCHARHKVCVQPSVSEQLYLKFA